MANKASIVLLLCLLAAAARAQDHASGAALLPLPATVIYNKTFSYLDASNDWKSNPQWTCNGRMQSPIAIDFRSTQGGTASNITQIEWDLINALPQGLLGTASNLSISNRGGSVMVSFGSWAPNRTLISQVAQRNGGNETLVWQIFNRTVGTPLQMHFHGYSEHVMNGQIFPTELHIVRNQSAAQCQGSDRSCLAVFAILFYLPDRAYANATLPIVQEIAEWTAALEYEKTDGGEYTGETMPVPNASLNLAELFPSNPSFYRYRGSLTSPPCTEGVEWTIFKNTQIIDIDAWDLLLTAIARGVGEIATNRHVQPLNGRTVYSINRGESVTAAG